ncbi:hypothetical protein V6N12_020033 [Hibiscus sabdariffa]|uniref:RNase H type-1 domain-containing protein n=1 Tax=Hibiscus sabdariffa TaxID=183260 RepID=A0ABR2B6C9_9ROSI
MMAHLEVQVLFGASVGGRSGGVFRDEFGRWFLGFARFVGRCDVLIVELLAIHDGLLQAWVSGYSRVELESDCLEAVRIITSSSSALDGNALVVSIKELIGREWSVVVHHIGYVNNRVVDMLASRDRGLDVAHTLFSGPPADIASIVEEELAGHASTVGEVDGIR